VWLLLRTHAKQVVATALAARSRGKWEVLEQRNVVVAGWPAAVVLLQRVRGQMVPNEGFEDVSKEDDAAPSQVVECMFVKPVLERRRLGDALQILWSMHIASQGVARKTIRRGRVFVAGVRATQWREELPPGTRVVFFPDYGLRIDQEAAAAAFRCVDMLWEGDEMAIVSKPPGMPVHGSARCLHAALSCMNQDGPGLLPSPVPLVAPSERTGGVVLLARTVSAAMRWFETPRDSNFPFTWDLLAVVVGVPSAGSLAEVAPLGGCVERSQASVRFHHISLVSLRVALVPNAEQALRCRLAELGHPVVGDRQYKHPSCKHLHVSGGLYLWSDALCFPGEPVCPSGHESDACGHVRQGPPAKFQSLFDKERRFWAYGADAESQTNVHPSDSDMSKT